MRISQTFTTLFGRVNNGKECILFMWPYFSRDFWANKYNLKEPEGFCSRISLLHTYAKKLQPSFF